jgi:hypothetical protein
MPVAKCGVRRGGPLENAGIAVAVRKMALRRRRSRLPWIYLVYHARFSSRLRHGSSEKDVELQTTEGTTGSTEETAAPEQQSGCCSAIVSASGAGEPV